MLKGWTLTDLHCDQCQTTPLMREPAASASSANRARIQFCALCDGSPAGRLPPAANTSGLSASSNSNPALAGPSTSTPKAAQPDPSESISTLLLQGYSLLGENCTNPQCRGIPLVGYPKKKDGSRDGRKMCVSCGGRWVDGNDLKGMTLMPNGPSGAGGMVTEEGSESPRSKARREMYGLSPSGMDVKGKQVGGAPSAVEIQDHEEDGLDLDLDLDSEPGIPTVSTVSSLSLLSCTLETCMKLI